LKKLGKKKNQEKAPGKGKGKKKLLLLPVLLAVLVGAGFFVLRSRGGGEPAGAQESEQPSPSPEETQTPEPTASPTMTLTEAVDYLEGLSPQSLGLSGESMDGYSVFPAESVVPVNGLPCVELSVYEHDEQAGTNSIAGIYLLSRGAERRLFRLDPETNMAVELSLTGGSG